MTIATPHLEYLSAREQLIQEIEQIIEKDLVCLIAGDYDKLQEDVKEMIESDKLIAMLSDAVCKHFPTTAQDSIQSCWIPEPINPES